MMCSACTLVQYECNWVIDCIRIKLVIIMKQCSSYSFFYHIILPGWSVIVRSMQSLIQCCTHRSHLTRGSVEKRQRGSLRDHCEFTRLDFFDWEGSMSCDSYHWEINLNSVHVIWAIKCNQLLLGGAINFTETECNHVEQLIILLFIFQLQSEICL